MPEPNEFYFLSIISICSFYLLKLLYVEYTDEAMELMDAPARQRHVERKQRNADEFARFFTGNYKKKRIVQ